MVLETETLRADLLEAQQSEAEARAALQQSAEYGKLLLSRNEALEQELELLRQEQSRKAAAEVSQRSRLEEECRRLEQELEAKSRTQERSRSSRLLSLSGSMVDSDEEPSLAQMQQRLKRCEKSEQEHREAAWLAEEQANVLEERNRKLEEELRRLQAQLARNEVRREAGEDGDKRSEAQPQQEAQQEAQGTQRGTGSLSFPTSPASSWSPFRRRTRLSAAEDLAEQIQALTAERDAAQVEKASCEARCEARLRETEEEVTALRLLLEEETTRTDTMAQHIDYLGNLLEERQAVNGAAVMLRSLGLSRHNSPEREGELLSSALAFKADRLPDEGSSAKTRRPYRDSSVASRNQDEIPSLQSFLADLRSRSPSMSRRRSRAPHRTLEDFLGEKPTSLANVTASTRAVASLSPSETDTASKVSLLELLGWSRCSHCGSVVWWSNESNGNGRQQSQMNGNGPGKNTLAKSWTLALSEETDVSPPVRGRPTGRS